MRSVCADGTLLRPLVGVLLAGLGGAGLAAGPVGADELSARFDVQMRQIEALKAELARQEAALLDLKREVDLERRGRGVPPTAGVPGRAVVAQAQAAPVQPGPARPVGQAPEARDRPPEVAPIFEQPGVLTPRGKWVFEPSLQYSYSSSDRIALVGYTVIPAILVGLLSRYQDGPERMSPRPSGGSSAGN